MSREDNLNAINQERVAAESQSQQERDAAEPVTQSPYAVLSQELQAINVPNGLSGSLTQLSDGSSYLVAGENIEIVSASNGSITVSSTVVSTPGGSDGNVQFNDGGTAVSGSSAFTFDKTANALSAENISGSLTSLADGSDYLRDGGNILLTTGTNGSITVDQNLKGYFNTTLTPSSFFRDERNRGYFDFASISTSARNALIEITGSLGSNTVYAIEPDGLGGAFVGGQFTTVNQNRRNNLAHIDSNGQLSSWDVATDAVVRSLKLSGSTLFAGGDFTAVGVVDESSFAVNTINGQVETFGLSVAGSINTTLELDDGSIIVGGSFTRILGHRISYLAKINSDGTLNPDWSSSYSLNGSVIALALSGSTLFVGGNFSSPRFSIAAVDVNTGKLVTAFNASANNQVNALAISGSTLYAGGSFTTLGGSVRSYIGAVDTTIGNLVTSFNPGASLNVYSLVVSGSNLFVGGWFTTLSGSTRNRLGAVDTTTGNLVPNFNPDANGDVRAIALSGSTLYVCGNFTTLSGSTRNKLGAVDTTTGNLVTAFNPNAGTTGQVLTMALSGSTLYAGGTFTSFSGSAQGFLAAADTTTGNQLPFAFRGAGTLGLSIAKNKLFIGGTTSPRVIYFSNKSRLAALNANYRKVYGYGVVDQNILNQNFSADANNSVNTLAISGSRLYAGGTFTTLSGSSRSRLGAVDTTTGNLVASFDPNVSSDVFAITSSGSALYVGGNFTTLSGTVRNRLGAVNTTTGNLLPFACDANGNVLSFALSGSTLYVGGAFTTISGSTRNRLGAVDTTTGNPLTSIMGVDNNVNSIFIRGSELFAGGIFTNKSISASAGISAAKSVSGFYNVQSLAANAAISASVVLSDGSAIVGGDFTTILGQTRNRLAKINADGTLNPTFNPNANGSVYALQASGSTLFVGGAFTNLSGSSRWSIGAVNTSTGNLVAGFLPSASNYVRAFAVSGSNLFVGGDFTTIAGASRTRLAVLDSGTGIANAFTGSADGSVTALVTSGSNLYVGGGFNRLNGVVRNHFGVLGSTSGDIVESFDTRFGLSGSVNTLAVADSKLYIGGRFLDISKRAESAIRIDTTSGSIVSFMNVQSGSIFDGLVLTSVGLDDGSLIIGGSFSTVLGQPRANLAKINSNGTLNSSFNPGTNSQVRALAVSGSTLFLGGFFTTLSGSTRTRLGAVDTTTGNLVAGFSTLTVTGSNPQVSALAFSGSRLYVGGVFTSVGGTTRNNIYAVSTTTGALVTAFNPNVSSTVTALAISGSSLYVGGGFATISGSTRNRLGAVDTTTGNILPFAADTNATVNALALSGSRLYVGGVFTSFSGSTRNYIGAVDTTTGNLVAAFNPNASNSVISLALSGSSLYAGGAFGSLSGSTRNYIGAVDTTTGNLLPAFRPSFSGSGTGAGLGTAVYTVSPVGSDLFVGGVFKSISNVHEPYLYPGFVSVDSVTGELDRSNVRVTYSGLTSIDVNDIVVTGSNVYMGGTFNNAARHASRGVFFNTADVSEGRQGLKNHIAANENVQSSIFLPDGSIIIGGNFTAILGEKRNYLAKISSDGRLDTSWNPGANGAVRAFAISGSALYVGGDFTALSGSSRLRLGAVDTTTGNLLPFAANTDSGAFSQVKALAVSGSTLHVGGFFTTLSGSARGNLAAVDTTTGNLVTAFEANASQTVSALAISGSTLFVGGIFTSLSGSTRNRIGAVNTTTGNLVTTFNPDASNPVNTLAISGSTLFVGGNFSTLSGSSRLRLGAVDTTTGDLIEAFSPVTDNSVSALALSGSTLYVGGDFTRMNGGRLSLLAAINTTTGKDLGWEDHDLGGGGVSTLSLQGTKLFVGGGFLSADPLTRFGFFAADYVTGVTDKKLVADQANILTVAPAEGNNFIVGGRPSITGFTAQTRYVAKFPTTLTTSDMRSFFDTTTPPASAVSTLVAGDFFQQSGSLLLGGFDMKSETSGSFSAFVSTYGRYINVESGMLNLNSRQTFTGVTRGVGKYKFTLPDGYMFDTSVVQVGSTLSRNFAKNIAVGTATITYDGVGGGGVWAVVPIDNRQYVLVGKNPLSSEIEVWGADDFFTQANDIKITVSATFPVIQNDP
jgi:hypothetical protein